MNKAIDEIAISVLKKPLSDCGLSELQHLVQEYPYFGPFELLLAKKLQQENSSLYEEQVQKTSLYFQNRLWLDHLLNNSNSGIVIEEKLTVEETAPNEYTDQPPEEAVKEEMQEPMQPLSGIPIIEPVAKEITEQAPQQHAEEEVKEEMQEAMQPLSGIPNIEPVINQITEQAPEQPAEESMEAPPLEIPQLKFEAASTEITFEPYHTVDYFASQGIKAKEDDRPKDRFSQQLKSFTEWLKTMKRIPASEVEISNDPVRERKVEQMAEHSIVERHVITEAMAEVWIKQGNKAKAEEIYRKLSLLDPLKTSYFAAKIDELKKTS